MLKDFLKYLSFQTFFIGDRLGLHILPKHYYTPVPDYSFLRKNQKLWQKRTSLAGLNWDLHEQLDWLRKICEPYYHEVEGLNWYHEAVSKGIGPGYGPIESQVLHCFVRSLCPSTVIEIGSGVSTACMLRASDLNHREGRPKSRIISVEPYPTSELKELEEVLLIEEMCQNVPRSVFDQLKEGDLLFIDSTHAVKTGSEVIALYLDIIPQLPPNVFIHIHDIYLPYLYPRSMFSDYFASQETSLVLALLTNNRHLDVRCCLSALHYDRPAELKALLRDYRPQDNVEGLGIGDTRNKHFPSSLWLQTS